MIDIYIVYSDSTKLDILNRIDKTSYFLHLIDDQTLHGKKEAFKLKSFYGAKLSPFALIELNGKVIKAFYSEAEDVFESLVNYINNLNFKTNE